MSVVRIKASRKLFSEQEVSGLTGICIEHLRGVARSKHLGFLAPVSGAAGAQVEERLFNSSDLTILTVLYPPCQH